MILEVNGHDRAGKTTLVKNIYEALGARAVMLPRVSQVSDLIPKDPGELGAWLRGAPAEEIVEAHLHGYKRIFELCVGDKIYIMDRGNLSLQAGSLASVMKQRKCDVFEASELIGRINERVGYRPATNAVSVLLAMPLGIEETLAEIERRNGAPLGDSYAEYMRLFVMNLRLLSLWRGDLLVFNALINPREICDSLLDILARQSVCES